MSSLEQVIKTVREKQEASSEASQPSGMPPSYIVVKSTWLSGETQSQQPQPQSGHSHSFKLIKVKKQIIILFKIIFLKQTNKTSLEILFVQWNYLVKVNSNK